ENNFFYNFTDLGLVMMGPRGVNVNHNTILGPKVFLAADVAATTGLVFTNNIAQYGEYGVWGSGASIGQGALNSYFPSAVFSINMLFDGQRSACHYPAKTFVPTLHQVGLVNPAATDYRLSSTSPFLRKGTDGKDIGADMPTVVSMLANVTTGQTSSVLPST